MYPHDPLRRVPSAIRRAKCTKVEVWILCIDLVVTYTHSIRWQQQDLDLVPPLKHFFCRANRFLVR
jgi:hypothetical protein